MCVYIRIYIETEVDKTGRYLSPVPCIRDAPFWGFMPISLGSVILSK